MGAGSSDFRFNGDVDLLGVCEGVGVSSERDVAEAVQAIMDDTAGVVPVWGYELLNAGPEASLGVLVPWLKDGALVKRERAAVAIGYMGEAGAGAAEEVRGRWGRRGRSGRGSCWSGRCGRLRGSE